MTFVIIGSGPAGVYGAEAIRARLPDEQIVMVSKDPRPACSPVMLTYWLTGKYGPQRLYFRSALWAEKHRITLKTGTEVAGLENSARQIVFEKDEPLCYDRLLIATGTSATALPIPGADSRGVGFCRNLHDAEGFLKEQTETRIEQVVIIGAGFIGLKLACHLFEKGLHVILLEKESRVAARILDDTSSWRVTKALREHGINVETGVEAREILSQKSRVSGIRLKDGRSYECEGVIQAVGVQPNIRFLQGSGMEWQHGIVVNDRMQTNLSGIYAAGDVTLTMDSISGRPFNNATWPAATRQGRVAGVNMAGGSFRYLYNFPINSLELLGQRVMAAGHPLWKQEPGIEVSIIEKPHSYRKLLTRHGILIGFILVGDISGAGMLLNALKSKKETACLPAGVIFPRQISVPPNFGYRRGHLF